jgi:Oligosaccharyl transferase STT3 subunit
MLVAAGTFLRLDPARRADGVELDFDPAFHYRMLVARVATGEVPGRDPLGFAPEGRPVPALLPTLLYDVATGWHQALTRSGIDTDLTSSALSFTAVTGGLIALPIWALARGLGLGAGPALIAAAFATFCPAHVHRSAAHWFRYDALGSLFLLGHAAAVAGALAARRGWRLAAASGGAAILLGLAIATWRVSLLAVLLESLFLLLAFLTRRLRPHHWIAFAPGLALALVTSLAVPYLLTGPFLLSRTGALAFLTLGLVLLDAATSLHALRGIAGHATRIVLAGAILLVSARLASPSAYDQLGDALAWKLGARPAGVSGALLATNTELATAHPTHLFAPDFFSALAALPLLYGLGRVFPRRRPFLVAPPLGRASGFRFWHGATVMLLGLTLLFARNKVLLGPMLSLYAALLVEGARASNRRPVRWLGPALVLVALAITARDARRLVEVLPARLEPEVARVVSWLKSAGRPGDVLLGDWGRGYATQLHAGLATATDGLLEVPGMPERIETFARALYAPDPAPLRAHAAELGARFLWIPGDRRQVNADYAGLRYADYFTDRGTTALGARTNYARLLGGEAMSGFVPRFRAGPHVIYEVLPEGHGVEDGVEDGGRP